MEKEELTQWQIALHDIVSIGSRDGSQQYRIAEAIKRVERYKSESASKPFLNLASFTAL